MSAGQTFPQNIEKQIFENLRSKHAFISVAWMQIWKFINLLWWKTFSPCCRNFTQGAHVAARWWKRKWWIECLTCWGLRPCYSFYVNIRHVGWCCDDEENVSPEKKKEIFDEPCLKNGILRKEFDFYTLCSNFLCNRAWLSLKDKLQFTIVLFSVITFPN